jgi:hypothetical protein
MKGIIWKDSAMETGGLADSGPPSVTAWCIPSCSKSVIDQLNSSFGG